jgi:hypothetical protein
MAGKCLGPDGKVNVANCNILKDFLLNHDLSANSNDIPIKNAPYCNIPGMELIRDQVSRVLDKISTFSKIGDESTQTLAQVLDGSATMHASASNGQKILDKMKQLTGGPADMSISYAILQSLFTLHRQIGLPTCNMDAIIINETLNNPARLARIFRDIVT